MGDNDLLLRLLWRTRWAHPVLRWVMDWQETRGTRPGGGRWQSMDQIRAEYAQTILDDARHDPNLDQVLDHTAAQLRHRVRATGGPLLRVHVMAYANGLLDALSETPETIARICREHPPTRDREPLTVAYGSYSPHMLTLAALCRLHGTLRL